LLILAACIRAAGELLAIRVLGGMTLAVDVYALASLTRLHHRERAVAPVGLAALFLLSLPVERIAQRLIGFPLQLLSAKGACGVLSFGWTDVVCDGVNIDLAGTSVLVDLPCSGTQGLFIVAIVFLGLATTTRPRLLHLARGVVVALAAGLFANTLRISALASGIARGGRFRGSFEHGIAHDAVGLVALALAIVPVLVWSWRVVPAPVGKPSPTQGQHRGSLGIISASVGFTLALLALLVPARPVDVSAPFPDLRLPHSMGGAIGVELPLTAREAAAYTAHGGSAVRARYGDHSVLIVRTSSPLRHLHAPEECMTALGARVERLGVTHESLPSAIYRVRHPDGQVYRVAVTFFASDGTVATSVAEAVFHWLSNPNTTWTGVQRVAPWHIAEASGWRVERDVAAVFDLPFHSI
jgi:exosortase/archaeosortase family protein